MDKQHLLILGGGALNMNSVREAKNYGFITYVADQNPGAPCFTIADYPIVADINSDADVLDKIKNYPIDGVVSMAEVGVLTAAKITERLGTHGINVATALNCTSKAVMRKEWKDTGYSVQYRVIKSFEEAIAAAKEIGSYPLIMKPDKTFGGSRGVSKILSVGELKNAYDYAAASGLNDLIVLEACAEGPEYSCEVIVSEGIAHVLCIGQKIKSPVPYRVDCSVQYPALLSQEQESEVARMCHAATTKTGIENGVAHVEFACTEHGFKLFELGARCGGGHTPMIAKHVSGVNEFIAYCRIACGIKPEISPYNVKKGADYRFIIFEPGIIEDIMIPDALYADPRIYDLVITTKKGDEVPPLINTSARAGAVVTFTDTFHDATTLADEVCLNIKVKYTDGRVRSALLFGGE